MATAEHDKWRRQIADIEAQELRNKNSADQAWDEQRMESFKIFDAAVSACRREKARLMRLEPKK